MPIFHTHRNQCCNYLVFATGIFDTDLRNYWDATVAMSPPTLVLGCNGSNAPPFLNIKQIFLLKSKTLDTDDQAGETPIHDDENFCFTNRPMLVCSPVRLKMLRSWVTINTTAQYGTLSAHYFLTDPTSHHLGRPPIFS